jgi:hypothetical protein
MRDWMNHYILRAHMYHLAMKSSSAAAVAVGTFAGLAEGCTKAKMIHMEIEHNVAASSWKNRRTEPYL